MKEKINKIKGTCLIIMMGVGGGVVLLRMGTPEHRQLKDIVKREG